MVIRLSLLSSSYVSHSTFWDITSWLALSSSFPVSPFSPFGQALWGVLSTAGLNLPFPCHYFP